LRNFDVSILRDASLKELTAMAKQKISNSKLLSQVMAANYEQVANFPIRIEAGTDDCTGKVHKARFARGFVGDAQDLWKQARDEVRLEGHDPIGNYEVVSMGLGDLLSPKVWAEIHKLNSRELSIRMLSRGSVEQAWRTSDKSEPLKDFTGLLEFKVAVATLELATLRVMPWNYGFSTVSFFLTTMDFGEAELGEKPSRLKFLTDFVDEALRANARNWEEKKSFTSFQELSAKWQASISRNLASEAKDGDKRKERSKPGKPREYVRLPDTVCRKFNEDKCDCKDDKHPAAGDPSKILEHLCSKFLADKRAFCLKGHPYTKHK
jgi:hypothetical protein